MTPWPGDDRDHAIRKRPAAPWGLPGRIPAPLPVPGQGVGVGVTGLLGASLERE